MIEEATGGPDITRGLTLGGEPAVGKGAVRSFGTSP